MAKLILTLEIKDGSKPKKTSKQRIEAEVSPDVLSTILGQVKPIVEFVQGQVRDEFVRRQSRQ